MRINYPPRFDPYMYLSGYPSADGYIYCGMIGNGPNGFRYYVWRQDPNGATGYIDLGQPLDHGSLNLTPDGLYCVGFVSEGRTKVNHIIKVPGYVPMASPGLQTPFYLPTAASAEDGYARSTAIDANEKAGEARKKIEALTAQVNDHLTHHPAAGTPVDYNKVREIAAGVAAEVCWAKAGDRLYAETQAALGNSNHYLAVLARSVAEGVVQALPVDTAKITAQAVEAVKAAITSGAVKVPVTIDYSVLAHEVTEEVVAVLVSRLSVQAMR